MTARALGSPAAKATTHTPREATALIARSPATPTFAATHIPTATLCGAAHIPAAAHTLAATPAFAAAHIPAGTLDGPARRPVCHRITRATLRGDGHPLRRVTLAFAITLSGRAAAGIGRANGRGIRSLAEKAIGMQAGR